MCGASLHTFCVLETVREMEASNATTIDDKLLCSLSCYCFTLIDGLTPDTVTTERVALTKKNKEQLKKEARDCQIKVYCRVNGVSRDVSKDMIIARLLKKNSSAASCICNFIEYGRDKDCSKD
jgi:hypothetical protein